ncbi:MAG: CHAD domain-containing protein [Myxococcales bacterium]|nr:CHAD domain-containing protein [Myxococcales bacterium]
MIIDTHDPSAAPALEAIQVLLTEQSLLMQQRVAGVIADEDQVHLHQFRVALRRSRAVLSTLRRVFPEREGRRFRKRLRWIGRVTGPVRDLDVWLTSLADYAFEHGQALDLAPLLTHLADERRAAHTELLRQMRRKRFRQTMRDWHTFVSKPWDGPDRPWAADLPIQTVVSARIAALYNDLVTTGDLIAPRAPDSAVHAMRIQVKKLRYLVALFGPLYGNETIAPLRRPHRRLQNCLGDFNDYAVQLGALDSHLHANLNTGNIPPVALVAMGRLMGYLIAKKDAQRARFYKRFAEFSSPDSRAAYLAIFGPVVSLRAGTDAPVVSLTGQPAEQSRAL